MRSDWTEVASLAQSLGNTKWQYRAQGQLGFADFYDGDLPGAQRNVAQALIGATKAGDIGGQIFYLSTTASGLVLQGMNDQANLYAIRAIAIAEANPDAGYPIIAHQTRPVGSTADVLRSYRMRWQIELLFKRLKSLAQLGHLPKHDDRSSRAWLYGKLFVTLLAQKLIRIGRDISPSGHPVSARGTM